MARTYKIISLMLVSILFLSACSATGGKQFQLPDFLNPNKKVTRQAANPAPQNQAPVRIENQNQAINPQSQQKILMLLPLSGRANDVGEAMLNAAQLAMADLGAQNFELMPRDTAGTPEIARAAAEQGLNDGAALILGPLFAEDTKAVAPVAANKNVQVISFSTDVSASSNNTFILGFLPSTQITRVLDYALQNGKRNIALIAPRDAYGDVAFTAFQNFMALRGGAGAGLVRYSDQAPTQTELQTLQNNKAIDAVLIATNGVTAGKISDQLNALGISQANVTRLGTGLWEQEKIAQIPSLQGAFYAASNPQLRARFEQNYKQTYGAAPPRLASLGYDAAALAIVLHKTGRGFSREALLNPNGFAGVDGIFRFRNDGSNERGLAVFHIQNNKAVIAAPASTNFMK